MSILNIEALLAPISDEEPCGQNLEYDAAYGEFEAASRGKPERQYGETIIPSEAPNWREVSRIGGDLANLTKDLRIGCLLARGLLITDGLQGFADGLALVRGYVEHYWETVHPQLDPADDNDPTLRVNTVSSLADKSTTIQSLYAAPMVWAGPLARYSLRDWEIAQGEVAAPHGVEAATVEAIEAAFENCELDDLRNVAVAVAQSLEDIAAIEAIVTLQVGAAQAVSLENLAAAMQDLNAILSSHLARRERLLSEAMLVSEELATAEGDEFSGGAPGGAGGGHQMSPAGEIRSREDVVRAIDKICEYYERHEPSSPLPLLLRRARRLADKSFLDILQDLTPDVVPTMRALGGVNDDADGG